MTDLRALQDRFEILDLYSNYAIGMDRGDRARFASVWSEDAVWLCAELRLELVGKAAILAYYDSRPGRAPSTPDRGGNLRLAGNHVIEVHGDTASGLAEFVAYRFTGSSMHPYTMGHYEDVFVRDETGWRLRRRDMVVCPVQAAP
ncbi:nuclear transport factor 2 family protein [Dactylosporangium sp. NPDC005572]|uniref:nuclear transport factor 2 family protein n=1 Tax=Dactylosporangium sp. NPDC005572 TaxID=3156889 RepID=UPI0033A43A34